MVSGLRGDALAFDYPGTPRAVDGVDAVVEAGEMVAVIGPNGSGKSTLLKLLAGILAPKDGRVLFGGEPVSGLRPKERARRIAVIPQTIRGLPDVEVETFVMGGRYGHFARFRGPSPHDHEVVRHALEQADASEFTERLLHQLSGGQQQRVLIARALAQEAELLLVDEPTTSLDPSHQLMVFELLARLTDAERGVLVVTHDLNLASQFADRIVLMENGRVRATGDAAAVLRPEVLEPVYGPHFFYGSLDVEGAGPRPFVVPTLSPE